MKAEEYAAILYGCYRRTDADSPEIFLGAAIAVLTGYPEFVVRAVCDPRHGLPAKSKFPPNIFELTVACNEKIRPLLEAERRKRIEEENAADRPSEVNEIERQRRKDVVARWRAAQALHEATTAGVETPLETLDARKLHGKHRELVTAALDAKIARLQAENLEAAKLAVSPLRLSALALRSLGLSPVEQGERG